MRRNNPENNFRVIFLLVLLAFSATVGLAQSVANGSEAAFDYVQMKRSVARQFWNKEIASPQELNSAIRLLGEIFAYLAKPEIRKSAYKLLIVGCRRTERVRH